MLTRAGTVRLAAFDGLLQALGPSAFVTDRRGRIVAVTDRYPGNTPASSPLVGHRCAEVLHDRGACACPSRASCPLARARRSGRASRAIHRHRVLGTPSAVEVLVRPLEPSAASLFLFQFRLLEGPPAGPEGERLVGRSLPFLALLGQIEEAAASTRPVLLAGEPGTGKRLAARTIHALSTRRRGPLVSLDAATLDTDDADDADRVAACLFEGAARTAEGGTLLVHHVAMLPPAQQRDLGTLLVDRPAGAPRVRVIATTDATVEREMEGGRLRLDLLEALGDCTIAVPSLDARRTDIPWLAAELLPRVRGTASGREFGADAIDVLMTRRYPSNVRDLAATVAQACRNSVTPVVGASSIPC